MRSKNVISSILSGFRRQGSLRCSCCVYRMSFESIPIVQIFLPMITFGIVILCCTAFCKAFHRAREERLEREERRDRPSIFVIPFPAETSDNEDIHLPPRYSMTEFYSPPPSYNEVEMKPDFIDADLPPAYSEIADATSTTTRGIDLVPPHPHRQT
ncbi:hypothetical protein UPYG_G00097150 [Umbra pygmaea]|uniref:Transmembrane protein 92 n=1 Tax=Umbra pygmaea TaxID=75934 RepID=A0ABD0X036_UMBPY